MGLDFFRRAIGYVEKYRKPGQSILHTIQTNGTLLDDEWGAFFKQNNFLVGLSVDGPKDMHDAYRVNKGGAGSFDQVMRGLAGAAPARRGRQHPVYRFTPQTPITRSRCTGSFATSCRPGTCSSSPLWNGLPRTFLPLANLGWGERPGAGPAPVHPARQAWSPNGPCGAEQFGRFLIAIFDEWVSRDVGKVFVQTFDVALGSWLGQHNLCIFSPTCGTALALEHNGDLYSCDHYVEPDYLLGEYSRDTDGRAGGLAEAARVRAAQARIACRSIAASARCCLPATVSVHATASSRRRMANPASTTCAPATSSSSIISTLR